MRDEWEIPDAPEPVDNGNGSLPALPSPGGVATQVSLGKQIEVRRAALAIPRDPGTVRRMIQEMAEWSGDSWEYEFEIGGKLISGPSVKCTNAVARAWGNCGIMTSNVQDIGDAWIIYSTFIDHQTGFDLTRGFRQRKGQQTIRTKDTGRAEDIVFQIGVSKSARNVIRNALGDVVDEAIRYARRRMTKAIEKDPGQFVERIKARLDAIGYPLVKVEAWAADKIERWRAPTIAQVIRVLTAHSEGALDDLDTIFAPKGVDVDGEANRGNGDAAKTAPEPRQPPPPFLDTKTPAKPAAPATAVPAQPEASKPRGRPKKPETIAREIIGIINSSDPEFVRAVVEARQSEIDALPQEFQDEIGAAAQEREAQATAAHDPDTGELPDDDSGGDPEGDPGDDDFEAWCQEMREDMAGRPREFLVAAKQDWIRRGAVYGDRAADAVNEAHKERLG